MPPSKFTPKNRQKILAALSVGAPLHVAAGLCGMHRTTVWKWVERGKAGEEEYAAFAEEMTKAREAGCAKLLSTLHIKAVGGWVEDPVSGKRVYIEPDRQAAQFLLERCHGFSNKMKVEHEHSGTVVATIPDLSALSVEQLRAMAWPEEEDEPAEDPGPGIH